MTAPAEPPVGVVGLGHLGLVVAAGLAAAGPAVVALGEPAEAAAVRAGRLPVHEPGLADLLRSAAPEVTGEPARLAGCSPVVVALDVPTDAGNRADLAPLDAWLARLAPALAPAATVVLMSQVPVGYCRAADARLRAARPEWRGRLYYWVETLVIGEAIARYRRPERIILGTPPGTAALDPGLAALTARFGCPVLAMSWESAELAKAGINLYLAMSVTVANALADLCEATGASMREVAPALRGDRRIGPAAYLRPGLGLAGGNLERDVVQLRELARRTGADPGLFELILARSAARAGWLAAAVERRVLDGAGPRPRLALWGLAYKRDSASTKNAPSLRLIAALAGRAALVAYDPQVAETPAGVERAATALGAARGADGLVIATDWPEFAACDLGALRAALARPVVIDGVGVLDPARARAAGLEYLGVGEAR